jgi:hypothetical protein
MKLFKKIRHLIFAVRYKRAVRQAKALAKTFNVRYYVLYFGGKPIVIPKKTIKELIRRKRFKKGTTVEDIEKIALFITD